jgi:DNA-binding transcriptional LysR family regulator
MKKNSALLNPLLEAFISVAKHKTVHGGARAIYISQTAMTQRILNLEKKLKTTLFIRTRQGMHLTSEGEKLLRYCHIVSDFSQETLSDMMKGGIECIQRIKISGPSSIMISRIIPTGMQIMKQFPQLYTTFDVNDTDNAVELLRSGSSQFAIFEPTKVTRDMTSKLLSPEEYLLVCTKAWKGRTIKDILRSERIIDFDESDQTTINYLKRFNLLQYAQTDRLFTNRIESLLKMLIEGYGYGVLTKEFSHSFIKKGHLIKLNHGKTFDNVLALAWYFRPEPPNYFSAIMNAIT